MVYIYNIDMTYIWVALKISHLKTPSTTWLLFTRSQLPCSASRKRWRGGKGCHLENACCCLKKHTWNLKHPLKHFFFPLDDEPNLYMGNGCFTKHTLKIGCLGFQSVIHRDPYFMAYEIIPI